MVRLCHTQIKRKPEYCKIYFTKSFLTYKSNKPQDRLESSLAVSALAINNGADIIRVHDIEKTIESRLDSELGDSEPILRKSKRARKDDYRRFLKNL